MQLRTKSPRFKRESPEKRRADLVQAAMRCLSEGGMAAFKMERIAAEAGVSLGLLSHYFTDKNELLTEVYRAALYDQVNGQLAKLNDKDAPGTAVERLCRIVDAIIDPLYLAPANLTMWLALWSEIVVNPELRRTHRALYRSYLQSLADLIGTVAKERRREVNAIEIARDLQALIDGLFLERALDRRAVRHADFHRASYEFLALHLGKLASAG
jgi:TetR/AcrR family transcriptional regulator, transcriptional repressor of bet genes